LHERIEDKPIKKDKERRDDRECQREHDQDAVGGVSQRNQHGQNEDAACHSGGNAIARQSYKDPTPKGTSNVTGRDDNGANTSSILGNPAFVVVHFNRFDFSACPPTSRGVSHFMNEDSDQFHGFKEWGLPEDQIDEEVTCEEAAECDFFRSTTCRQIPIGTHDQSWLNRNIDLRRGETIKRIVKNTCRMMVTKIWDLIPVVVRQPRVALVSDSTQYTGGSI
jgi:hypothetical protein